MCQTHEYWVIRFREALSPKVAGLPLVQVVQRTMVQGRNHGPQVSTPIFDFFDLKEYFSMQKKSSSEKVCLAVWPILIFPSYIPVRAAPSFPFDKRGVTNFFDVGAPLL